MYEHPRNRSFGHSRARHPGRHGPHRRRQTRRCGVCGGRLGHYRLWRRATRVDRRTGAHCPRNRWRRSPRCKRHAHGSAGAPGGGAAHQAARRRGYHGRGQPCEFHGSLERGWHKGGSRGGVFGARRAHGAHGRRRGGCRGLRGRWPHWRAHHYGARPERM